MNLNRRYTPMNADRGYTPMDANRRYTPMNADRGYTPMDANRRYTPIHANRRYTPMDGNRRYAPITAEALQGMLSQQNTVVHLRSPEYGFICGSNSPALFGAGPLLPRFPFSRFARKLERQIGRSR
jgi:hypothetical protein